MKWNSPEGRHAFDYWLLGGEVKEFLDLAKPAQISELTIAAGGFLRRQNSGLHVFSAGAVQNVCGVRRLDALTLSHDPSEDSYTFVRTFGLEDPRSTTRDTAINGPRGFDLETEDMTNVDDLAIGPTGEYICDPQDDFLPQLPDIQVQKSVLRKDTYLDLKSDLTLVWPDAQPVVIPDWGGSFQTGDYMQLRHAISAESRQRRL